MAATIAKDGIGQLVIDTGTGARLDYVALANQLLKQGILALIIVALLFGFYIVAGFFMEEWKGRVDQQIASQALVVKTLTASAQDNRALVLAQLQTNTRLAAATEELASATKAHKNIAESTLALLEMFTPGVTNDHGEMLRVIHGISGRLGTMSGME